MGQFVDALQFFVDDESLLEAPRAVFVGAIDPDEEDDLDVAVLAGCGGLERPTPRGRAAPRCRVRVRRASRSRSRVRGRRGRAGEEEDEEGEEAKEAPPILLSPLREEARQLLNVFTTTLPAGKSNLSVRRQMDPLLRWKEHEATFPIIAEIARKMLAVPATSSDS